MASAATRRSTKRKDMTSPSTLAPNVASMSSTKLDRRRSPFQPTSLEATILAIYPTILILGALFALVDPATRASSYDAATQSHPPETAPSYFARKGNLFNTIFVKRGWFWITASFFLFLFTHPSTSTPRDVTLTPKRIRGFVRWGMVTTWWIFVTQWFFGPAIIDRGFLLTGGQCELARQADNGDVNMDSTRQFVTSMACKAVGGKWAGGHDISGHVFLLVLGSMFLLEEVLHVVLRSSREKEERTILMADGAVKSAVIEAVQVGDSAPESYGQWNLGVKFVMIVSGLSIWMLLMTAAYFHTWFEKFTGLMVAFFGIFFVYFLPRAVPSLRKFVGMPGV